MCKSKAEGGARCASHIRSNHAKKLAAKVKAQKNLELRKQQKEQNDNWETRRNLETAQRVLVKTENQFNDAEAEKLALELQPKEKKQGKGTTLNRFIGNCLKPGEWEQLTQEAKERGTDRSKLIRDRLNGYPAIHPVTAGYNPWQRWDGNSTWGRQPTQGAKGDYLRESRGVRVSAEDLTRLEREAGLFGLTRSDYVRCVVMGRDPRTFGHHISEEYAADQLTTISKVEQLENVTPQNVQAFWQERIAAERKLVAQELHQQKLPEAA